MSTKRNRLTHAEFYQLCTYLETHKEALQGRTEEVIMQRATEDLGFSLSTPNLRSAAEAIGADWIAPKRKARKVEVDADDVQLLAERVVLLTKLTGCPVPPQIARMAGHANSRG